MIVQWYVVVQGGGGTLWFIEAQVLKVQPMSVVRDRCARASTAKRRTTQGQLTQVTVVTFLPQPAGLPFPVPFSCHIL